MRLNRNIIAPALFPMIVGGLIFWISCGRNSWKWFLARDWQITEATVISSGATPDNDPPGCFIVLNYAYEVAGNAHTGSTYSFSNFAMEDRRAYQMIAGPLASGRQTRVYFNPRQPSESVVNRAYDSRWFMGLFGLAGVGLGLAMMIENSKQK